MIIPISQRPVSCVFLHVAVPHAAWACATTDHRLRACHRYDDPPIRTIGIDQLRYRVARTLRDSPEEARCALLKLGEAAHNQVVLPTQWRRLDPVLPVECQDGGVDMVGLDEAGSACAPVARGRVLEAVAWLVGEAGEGRVRARYAEPTRVLFLLWCASHQREEESRTRRARE